MSQRKGPKQWTGKAWAYVNDESGRWARWDNDHYVPHLREILQVGSSGRVPGFSPIRVRVTIQPLTGGRKS